MRVWLALLAILLILALMVFEALADPWWREQIMERPPVMRPDRPYVEPWDRPEIPPRDRPGFETPHWPAGGLPDVEVGGATWQWWGLGVWLEAP